MKLTHVTPCVSRPGRSLAFAITSTPTSVIFRICEGGPVLRKNWGIK